MAMTDRDVGLIGLGTMGAALALNIAEKGFPIAVWNRTAIGHPRLSTPKPGDWPPASRPPTRWPTWSPRSGRRARSS